MSRGLVGGLRPRRSVAGGAALLQGTAFEHRYQLTGVLPEEQGADHDDEQPQTPDAGGPGAADPPHGATVFDVLASTALLPTHGMLL